MCGRDTLEIEGSGDRCIWPRREISLSHDSEDDSDNAIRKIGVYVVYDVYEVYGFYGV